MIGVLAARGTLRLPASCVPRWRRVYVIRRELDGAGLNWCGGFRPMEWTAPTACGSLARADLNRDAADGTLLGQVSAQGYRWHLSFPAAPELILSGAQLPGNHEATPSLFDVKGPPVGA